MVNVFVASMFWGGGAEFDLLAVRCAEFDGIASQVLVEGDRTFQGTPKPLRLREREHLVGLPADVSRYTAILPEQAHHPMVREAAQRNALVDALKLSGAEPEDIVVLCDADEIPSRACLEALRDGTIQTPVRLGLKLYHYYLNLRIVGGDSSVADGYWYAPIAVRVRDLREPGGPAPRTPHWWRQQALVRKVQNAGWSWSFLAPAGDAGVAAHQAKLAAWSHYEHSGPAFASYDNVARARQLGIDWEHTRNLTHAWCAVDDSYPAFIRDNPERFAQYVGVPPAEVRSR